MRRFFSVAYVTQYIQCAFIVPLVLVIFLLFLKKTIYKSELEN